MSVSESFPPPLGTESAEQAKIRKGVEAYWEVVDRFQSDASLTDLTELASVTVVGSEEASQTVERNTILRELGVEIIGVRQFRQLVIGQPTGAGGAETAVVTYCNDVSALSYVNAVTGKPAGGEHPLSLWETLTLQKSASGEWLVSTLRNDEGDC